MYQCNFVYFFPVIHFYNHRCHEFRESENNAATFNNPDHPDLNGYEIDKTDNLN